MSDPRSPIAGVASIVELSALTDLAPGTLVAGRYRVEARLGAGGMGVVYRATQEPLGRAVALKVLAHALGRDPAARARFAREARVMAQLAHPHAVEIHDFGEADGGQLFLAMGLVTGGTLTARLHAHGAPPLPDGLSLLRQLADFLDAARVRGLVHRDLKPDNLFVAEAPDGGLHVRVGDFGLAFLADDDALGRMTRLGMVVGTPSYMSPEQARGLEVGPESDVYALGCVAYEVLTGTRVFSGRSEELVLRHQVLAPEPLRERTPGRGIPAAVDALVLRMLRKDPDARPAPAEIRDAIDALLAGRGAARRGVARPAPPPEPPRGLDGALPVAVAVLGALPDALALGLRAHGFVPVAPPHVTDDMPMFAPGASLEVLRALRPGRIVTDADATDLERVAALIEAGVADVVTRPVALDDLVARLRRLMRRGPRSTR